MKYLGILMAVVLALGVAAPVALAETPTVANHATDTMTVQVTFLNNTLLGTFVQTYSWTDSNIVQIQGETWSFNGQMNGQPASASGTWDGVWDGKAYVGNITSITSWDMGTLNEVSFGGKVLFAAGTKMPKPRVPFAIGVYPGGSPTIWLTFTSRSLGTYSLPMTLVGPGIDSDKGMVPAPGKGSRAFSVTNTAGWKEITGLPVTGEGDSSLPSGGVNSAVLAVSTLGIGLGAVLVTRRLRCGAAV